MLISGITAVRLLAEGAKGARFGSDWRRYPDPATELEVYRLTDPAYTSTLAPYYNRSLDRRNAFLLFGCDRGGSPQAFRMDLKSGETMQLTDARALDASSLALLPDSRSAVFFDDRSLRVLTLSNLREREVYSVPDGWERGAGAGITGDGAAALFAEGQGGKSRLRSVRAGARRGQHHCRSAVSHRASHRAPAARAGAVSRG